MTTRSPKGQFKRLRRKRKRIPYLPPGTLVAHKAEGGSAEKPLVTFFDYGVKGFAEHKLERVEELDEAAPEGVIRWIDVEGLQDVTILERLGQRFGLHPLVLEDVLSPAQRPKVDDYDDYVFIVLHMISTNPSECSIDWEQVSIIFGRDYVITFQEGRKGDCFEILRDRIRHAKGRIRRCGADYLAYGLIDAIVDHHFEVLERIGDWIEALEEEIVEQPTQQTVQKVYALRRELLLLRKSIWPLRDSVGWLTKADSALIQQSTEVYLRDVHDHVVQIIDTLESYRDMLAGMLDIYLSSLSNRLNEVMKVLTMISTIFIPLSFVVGVYGMNFEFMPELHWRHGYLVVWGIIIAIAIAMLIYFRLKKWL